MEKSTEIKDSGKRAEFASGMVRDTSEGKTRFLGIRFGPMFWRWASHCTKGQQKYPDPTPGVPNWTLANSEEELQRFKESAATHFEQWLRGDTDEDHAAGVFFNINGAEYTKARVVAAALSTIPTKIVSPIRYCAECKFSVAAENALGDEHMFCDLLKLGCRKARREDGVCGAKGNLYVQK